jgi:hypothetical protein
MIDSIDTFLIRINDRIRSKTHNQSIDLWQHDRLSYRKLRNQSSIDLYRHAIKSQLTMYNMNSYWFLFLARQYVDTFNLCSRTCEQYAQSIHNLIIRNLPDGIVLVIGLTRRFHTCNIQHHTRRETQRNATQHVLVVNVTISTGALVSFDICRFLPAFVHRLHLVVDVFSFLFLSTLMTYSPWQWLRMHSLLNRIQSRVYTA